MLARFDSVTLAIDWYPPLPTKRRYEYSDWMVRIGAICLSIPRWRKCTNQGLTRHERGKWRIRLGIFFSNADIGNFIEELHGTELGAIIFLIKKKLNDFHGLSSKNT
jgi:hypothetical protein